MFEALFRVFFKYRPLTFEQGDFVFNASRSTAIAVLIAAIVAAAALATYRRVPAAATRRDRAILFTLRIAAVVLIALCLFRPTLVLKAAVPQQNFLGVLVDDSRSMQITDAARESRAGVVKRLFATGSTLAHALSDRFVVRTFRFSSSTENAGSIAAFDSSGTSTRVGQALDRARDALAGLPLAGLVLVTDGADTSDRPIDETLAALKARGIPVFTVGVGSERFARDIQVTRVETPRTALKGSALVVNAVITQTGYAGQKVPLTVEDEGRIVGSETVALPPDGQSATVRVHVTANDAGPRQLTFKLPVQDGEEVTGNNTRQAIVRVDDARPKILYFEGEPRPEMKFVRQAVNDDKNIQVVVLQRTAEEKYYRLGLSNPDELAGGFPKSREELFAYRGLILGSVEASAFTPEQLRMIADFVSRRGGGLLALGGRRAFAEGGWAGTPVAEALPVSLDVDGGRKPAPSFSELTIRPTSSGAVSPVTLLAAGEDASAARWKEMPQLSAVNAIRSAKPGATVLLTGTDESRQEQIVLASHRYGRGKAIAFTVQDSWLWRMDARMPVEDTTHQMFWRRLARWIVEDVPGPVSITTTSDRAEPGQAVDLTARVADPAFVDVDDASVTAHVKAPSGKAFDVPLDWTAGRDGEYHGAFTPDESGHYEVSVSAARAGKALGSDVAHVQSSAGDAEFFDAAMRRSLLERIADETGGRFYTPDTVPALPDAISYTGKGVTVVEERDLWDMPILLVALIALLGTEWGFRRARGLA